MILEKALNARIGIIARCDNTGLGVMTVDFFRNLMVQKVLVVPGMQLRKSFSLFYLPTSPSSVMHLAA
jgi:hypothetical protein